MIEAWSTDAVYAAEGALMATLDDGELMARAVEGLAGVAAARLEESGGESVAALVGPGNNGADALYAVARLAEAGWNAVAVHHDHVHEGARAAAEAAGVVLTTDPSGLGEADVVLDGILGIGARPGLPDWAVGWLAALSETAHVIAVDLPSGQDPMGGELDPDGVFADETVTFSVAKPVHLLPPTEQACGLLTVVDIGLEVDADPVVRRLDHDDVAALWPVPVASDDKYSRGVLGVVAGGESYSGAAVLSVTAAVEAGCGMVRYVGTPTPTALVRAAVPEAVHGAGRVQAWVVGPGLDVASRAAGAKAQLDVAREALAGAEPVVVDAGGLDLLDADVLAARSDAVTLLTPHAGECARLLTRLGDARGGPRAGRGPAARPRPRPRRAHRCHRAAQGRDHPRRAARRRVHRLVAVRRPTLAGHRRSGRRARRAARHAARRRPARRRRGCPRRPGPRRRRRAGQPRRPGARARGRARHPGGSGPPAGPRGHPGVLDSSGP